MIILQRFFDIPGFPGIFMILVSANPPNRADVFPSLVEASTRATGPSNIARIFEKTEDNTANMIC
jgi:hypothetical protein